MVPVVLAAVVSLVGQTALAGLTLERAQAPVTLPGMGRVAPAPGRPLPLDVPVVVVDRERVAVAPTAGGAPAAVATLGTLREGDAACAIPPLTDALSRLRRQKPDAIDVVLAIDTGAPKWLRARLHCALEDAGFGVLSAEVGAAGVAVRPTKLVRRGAGTAWGGPILEEGISRGELERGLKPALAPVSACLAASQTSAVSVTFVIGATGAVTSIDLADDTPAPAAACVERALTTLTWQRFPGARAVIVQHVFKRG